MMSIHDGTISFVVVGCLRTQFASKELHVYEMTNIDRRRVVVRGEDCEDEMLLFVIATTLPHTWRTSPCLPH